MLLGNPQHPDFGTYARFITSMGNIVELPNPVQYLCDKCIRPLQNIGDIRICQYCRGFEDGLKKSTKVVEKIIEKTVEVPTKYVLLKDRINNHEHTFSTSKRNNPCSYCGLFKDCWKIVSEDEIINNIQKN